MRQWVYALRIDDEDDVAHKGWVPMTLFSQSEEFLPEAIIEMPCPWRIEEAFDGTDRRHRTMFQKLQEDGATRTAMEDA